MKLLHYLVIGLSVSIFVIFNSCKKTFTGPESNLSSLSTLQVGTASSVIPYYAIDNSGKYLFLFVRDLTFDNGVVEKINLETFALEKTITIIGTVPISPDNIVVTDDNNLVSTFFNFAESSMLILKLNVDLNITKVDTVAHVPGGNYGRTRMVKKGNGKIAGVYSNQDTAGRCYLSYLEMDENLNILKRVNDSSTTYGSLLISGTNLIKTSDQGYLYTGENYDTPYYNAETLLEKRDANFNLKWRVKYKPDPSSDASPATLNEYNGKYYVYSDNGTQSAYVLVYDLNGNLLQNTTLKDDGIVFQDIEPMRLTENGEFLILAATKLNIAPNQQKGILYHTDANLKILSSEVFGGKGVSSGLIKVSANKYLHFYLDNSFTADNNLPRLVFRYLDAKGNIIK